MPFGGLLTVGIIGGVSNLVGAGIQAHQQSKAVNAQKEAADKALALQKDIYNQQQANEAPWRNTGASAITTLGGLLGLPSGGGGGSTGQLPQTNTLAGGMGMESGSPAERMPLGYAGYTPQGGVDTSMGALPPASASTSSYGSYGSGRTIAGQIPTLRVRAPNGTVYQIPGDQARQAQANGGTILGEV